MITEKNNFRRGEREYKGNDWNVRRNLWDLFGRRNAVSIDKRGLASNYRWFHLRLWANRSSNRGKKMFLHERLCLVETDSMTGQIVILVTQGSCLRRNDSHGDSRVRWDIHATLTFFFLYCRWPTKAEHLHDRTTTQQLNKISKISY